jgi:sec-independent protein translocase protein TatB
MFPEGRILDFLIVGVIALIVVGPKDLPILMRKVGRFIAHMRGLAAEFRASFDEMARQSELDELRREVEALKSGQAVPGVTGEGGVRDVFEDIHASLREGQVQLHPMMSHQYASGLDSPTGSAPAAPVVTPTESPLAIEAQNPPPIPVRAES